MDWVRAIDTAAVDAEGIAMAQVGEHRIAFYAVDGDYYATADVCSHGRAFLSEGFLDGHLVECPLHQGLFDVRTGAPAGTPCIEPVRSYPVKAEDGVLYVRID